MILRALLFWRRLEARWAAVPGNVRGPLLATVSGVGMCVVLLFAKLIGDRLPPAEVGFFRSIIGWISIWPFIAHAGLRSLRTRHFPGHIARGVLGGMGLICFLYSAVHLPMADATSYNFTRNLFLVFTAGIFLGEGFRRSRIGVTLVGFAGVLVMMRPDAGVSLPALVAVLGALISAVSAVFIKKLMATEAPVTVLFYFGMFMTLITAAPLPFVWVTPTLGELAYLLLLGITASVAQSCFIRAYRAADATLVAPFDYLQLVSATIIGFIAFGALPGVWTWLGAGIIVAANLWLTLSERRAARPPRG